MLNKILSLEGAQKLTKAEQKSINGGEMEEGGCSPGTCPEYYFCRKGKCVYNPPPYGQG